MWSPQEFAKGRIVPYPFGERVARCGTHCLEGPDDCDDEEAADEVVHGAVRNSHLGYLLIVLCLVVVQRANSVGDLPAQMDG